MAAPWRRAAARAALLCAALPFVRGQAAVIATAGPKITTIPTVAYAAFAAVGVLLLLIMLVVRHRANVSRQREQEERDARRRAEQEEAGEWPGAWCRAAAVLPCCPAAACRPPPTCVCCTPCPPPPHAAKQAEASASAVRSVRLPPLVLHPDCSFGLADIEPSHTQVELTRAAGQQQGQAQQPSARRQSSSATQQQDRQPAARRACSARQQQPQIFQQASGRRGSGGTARQSGSTLTAGSRSGPSLTGAGAAIVVEVRGNQTAFGWAAVEELPPQAEATAAADAIETGAAPARQ